MEATTMRELLEADEERLRGALRASRSVDKSREDGVEALREELGAMLLRYNAACAQDRPRQAVADGMTAAVRDALELLLAGEAEKESPGRRVSPWAVTELLAALVLGVAGVLLLGPLPVAGYVALGGALLCAFLSGRLWFRTQEVIVRAAVDPDAVWYTMTKTAQTMDRKLEEFASLERELAGERAQGTAAAPLSREETALFGDLLEALYAENGDFALRQLRQLPAFLEKRGVTLAEYGEETAELFEVLPSRSHTATRRPAMLAGEKLLLSGRATERLD